MLSIIIPANNEEGYIGDCLAQIYKSDDPGVPVQAIVVANACRDATVSEAQALIPKFEDRGWRLDVLDIPEGGKINALNEGDRAALYRIRIYIDADIRVSPSLITELAAVLDREGPAYAGGHLKVAPSQSILSKKYGRLWEHLPFITDNVHGCGVYGVNGPARAKWGEFPDVIADDTFVRYHFAADEMYGVAASYTWPITEGFANLVRVRRRQDEGLAEIRRLYPDLAVRMAPTAPGAVRKLGLFWCDPVGFVIYAAVAVAVRLPVFKSQNDWHRGR